MLKDYNHYIQVPPHFQELKCIWTDKYNHKLKCSFLIFFESPLQAMIALSLELMDTTKYWVPPL